MERVLQRIPLEVLRAEETSGCIPQVIRLARYLIIDTPDGIQVVHYDYVEAKGCQHLYALSVRIPTGKPGTFVTESLAVDTTVPGASKNHL